ncbi:hypothetical protein EV139_0847 [Leucobacter luti]|uniref:Uncharacterized protein n=1 Tax=Leucobacter luti TaxID=340320 RepID=A0A4Q7U1Z6_9MICO|nr:hypothetical protein EV139_0847 [Leucobacter luti]
MRLPLFIQDIVTGGLDTEIADAFARIKEAQDAGDEAAVRFSEGDILRASVLRERLTGEAGNV